MHTHTHKRTHLSNVRGLAPHVRPRDDLEPTLALLHDTIIFDEVHTILGFHARVSASNQRKLTLIRT